MKRPASLVTVAVLFVIVGLCGAWDIITGSSRTAITINFGVVGLLVGPGLLSLRPAWRRAAQVCLWLAIAVTVVAGALVLFASDVRFSVMGTEIGGNRHRAFALLAVAAALGLAVWANAVLSRPQISALFVRRASGEVVP